MQQSEKILAYVKSLSFSPTEGFTMHTALIHQHAIFGILLFVLVGVLAPAITLAPQTASADEEFIATKLEDILGIWKTQLRGMPGYKQYKKDGTYSVAYALENLQSSPLSTGHFWFEGNVYFQKGEHPLSSDFPGKYEVRVHKEEGKPVRLSFQVVDDATAGRVSDLSQGMTRVEAPVLPIEVTKDIVYAVRPEQSELPEEQFKLDVYAPVEPGNRPVVVYLGGMGEVKEFGLPLMNALAEQGVLAVSINFHGLHPRDAINNNGRGFWEMVETTACALRFARKKALDYGGKPTQLCLVGFSLGGGLAAQMALDEDELDQQWEEFSSRRGAPPRQVRCEVNEGSLHVDALVGISGAYDAFVGYDGKWGRDWLQANAPELWEMFYSAIGKNPDLKVRLIHGEHDNTIPLKNSSAFETVLSEAGYDVELIPFDGGHIVRTDLTVKTILDVLRDSSGNE